MSTIHNGAHPHDPDADRLSVAWNEIAAGRTPLYEDGPGELIATAELLHAEAPEARPEPNFRADLREKLMQTAIPLHAPTLAPLSRVIEAPLELPKHGEPYPHMPPAIRRAASRWIAIAATIALLLGTGAAAYLGGIGQSPNEPSGTNIAAPLVDGTPDSGTPVADSCASARPYLPCGNNPWVGDGLIVRANLSADALAASKVQFQSWEIEGSGHVTFSGPNAPLNGVGVDVVTSGAYRAAFSGPVVVSRPVPGGGSSFEYPGADTPIELSRGDSVTYQLGTKQELRNPHGSTALEFKSILIYEGDPTPSNLLAGGQYEAQIDGDGELPVPLSDYNTPEVAITVTYVHLLEGFPFPPEDTRFTSYVLGPVAPTVLARGPNEGFVVWASTPKG